MPKRADRCLPCDMARDMANVEIRKKGTAGIEIRRKATSPIEAILLQQEWQKKHMPPYKLAKCVGKKVMMGQKESIAVLDCDFEWRALRELGNKIRREVPAAVVHNAARPRSRGPSWEGQCLQAVIDLGYAKNQREAFFLCLGAKNRGMSIEELLEELRSEAPVTASYRERGKPRSRPKQYPAGGSKKVSHQWAGRGWMARRRPKKDLSGYASEAFNATFGALFRAADPMPKKKRFSADSIKSRLWIKGAVKHKGKLRSLLNVPPGQTIPSWIKEEGCKDPRRTYARVLKRIPSAKQAREFQRMACLARTLASIQRKKAKIRKAA